MTATRTPDYAERALDVFPSLLVQMIRAGAPLAAVRDEGFTPAEIAAVSELVLLADSTEHLDGGEQADRDARRDLGKVCETVPVTALSG